jgi:hypothetical protein
VLSNFARLYVQASGGWDSRRWQDGVRAYRGSATVHAVCLRDFQTSGVDL